MYAVARPQLRGQSVHSTMEKLNPSCRGECEDPRVRVILGFCAGPGTPAPPSRVAEQERAGKGSGYAICSLGANSSLTRHKLYDPEQMTYLPEPTHLLKSFIEPTNV